MTTKAEFVDKVAAKSGLSKKDAGAAVDAVISSIEDSVIFGDEVSFTGFGKFHVANRGAREGRNPRTGETMTIAASRVPRFTAGSGLQEAVQETASRALGRGRGQGRGPAAGRRPRGGPAAKRGAQGPPLAGLGGGPGHGCGARPGDPCPLRRPARCRRS